MLDRRRLHGHVLRCLLEATKPRIHSISRRSYQIPRSMKVAGTGDGTTTKRNKLVHSGPSEDEKMCIRR